jgi:3-methylcrotonyl-CoA carboxylase beta subunit
MARGKLLPRDRVQMLLDPGTPFLEIAPLAAHAMYLNKDGAPLRRRRLPASAA